MTAALRPAGDPSRPPADHPLPTRPLLSPWHRLARDDERVVLEYGGEAVSLEGRAVTTLLSSLLPLLDGTRTIGELARALGVQPQPVEHAVSLLAEAGVVVEGPLPPPGLPRAAVETALMLAASGTQASPAEISRRLARSSVRVVGSGPTASEILRFLRLSGLDDTADLAWGERSPGADLVVVAPAPGELPRLGEWNSLALAGGVEWLQVLPYDGALALIGPVYVPGETCCWECFVARRASNVEYGRELRELVRVPAAFPLAPSLAALTAGLAATLVLRRLLFGEPLLAGAAVALELGQSLRLDVHHVYRVPRCPACSTAATSARPLPWALAS